jgi:peptidoglycan biosynthesis protein MviN/MurJ (putative lipid II flippase)
MMSIVRGLTALRQRSGVRSLLGTAIGSAPGLLLPFAISTYFGVGTLTDQLAFAVALVTFVTALFDGTIQAAAIPSIEYERRVGPRELRAVLKRAFVTLPMIAIAIYALVAVLGLLLAPHDDHDGGVSSSWLLAGALVPFLIASVVSSIASAVLFVSGRFFAPMASAAARSVVPLAGLLLLPTDEHGLIAIAALMGIGETLRAASLSASARRRLRELDERPVAPPTGPRPRPITMAIAYATSLIFAGLVPVVTRGAAGGLAPGSTTVFDLAEKLVYIPATAVSAMFVVVAGTRWSRLHHDDPAGLVHDYWRTVRTSSLVAGSGGLVLLVGLVLTTLLAGPTLAGAPSDELRLTVAILVLTLPTGVISALSSRLLGALDATRAIPIIGVVSLLIAAAGSALLGPPLGLAGIATGLVLARLFAAVAFMAMTRAAFGPRS